MSAPEVLVPQGSGSLTTAVGGKEWGGWDRGEWLCVETGWLLFSLLKAVRWGPSAALPGVQKWISYKRHFSEGTNEHFCQGTTLPSASSAFQVVIPVQAAAKS